MKNPMKEDMFVEILLPEGTQELVGKQLPSLESINMWKDENNRDLFINEDITEEIVNHVGYNIRKWNIEDSHLETECRKPIRIFINTYGGDLNSTMFVTDLIKASKTPIHTICQGTAYSAGGLLLIAGHKRYCYPSSTYLLHSGSTGARGSMTQVFDSIEFQKKYEKRVKDFVCKHTNFTTKEYDKNYRVELYLDSDGMLEHGIVDEILTTII